MKMEYILNFWGYNRTMLWDVISTVSVILIVVLNLFWLYHWLYKTLSPRKPISRISDTYEHQHYCRTYYRGKPFDG
jgi:hypothetical protein